MRLPSNGADFSSIGVEPLARMTLLAVSSRRVPSCGGELNLPAGKQLAVTLQRCDPGRFEQRQDALGHGLDDAGLALLHLRHVDRHVRNLDAVRGKLVLRAVQQLGRLQQRLRRNTTCVQAGAAEGQRAVEVLPLVDAGDAEFVLSSANRSRIAGRAAADHDDVK